MGAVKDGTYVDPEQIPTNLAKAATRPAQHLLSDDEPLIDPDCRDDFKHATCIGGPCECWCHAERAEALRLERLAVASKGENPDSRSTSDGQKEAEVRKDEKV